MRTLGFEVKVHRHDWIREKDNPAKAEEIQRFCDHWYLVVGDEKVVNVLEGELPPTWGLLVFDKGKLVSKVEAPTLKAEPWTKPFMAALMRAATTGVVPRSALAALAEDMYEKRRKSDMEYKERDYERVQKDLQELRQRVQAFEKASGVDIAATYKYGAMANPELLGAAVKFVLERGLGYDRLTGLMNSLDATKKELAAAIEIAKGLPEIKPTAEDAAQ
jgi:hypothetical protein